MRIEEFRDLDEHFLTQTFARERLSRPRSQEQRSRTNKTQDYDLRDRSPIRDRDIATIYLRLILKVIGIVDVTIVAAGGSNVVDLGERSRDEVLSTFQPAINAAAQV